MKRWQWLHSFNYAPATKYWNCQNHVRLWTGMSVLLVPINYIANFYFATDMPGGLNLGVFGIGLTTTLCNGLNLLVVGGYSVYIWRSKRRFSAKKLTPNSRLLKKALKFGLPASGQVSTDTIGFSAVSYMAAFFGNDAVAVHQVVMMVSTLYFNIANGWGSAASIRIGYYLGAGKSHIAARLGLLHIFGMVAVFIILALLTWLNARTLIQFFFEDEASIEKGMLLLWICCLYMTPNAVQTLLGNTLRAWGDTRTVLYTNFAAFYLIGLPIAYYLAFILEMGLYGLWIGLVVILFLCTAFNIATWFYRVRKNPHGLQR